MKKIFPALLPALWIGSADAPAAGGPKTETAVFCGGCFWCMQPVFDKLPGVLSTTVGYTGGAKPDPTYEEVSSGRTGHCEAIQVVFDPARLSYRQVADVYWKNIDPTAVDRQFADAGSQYRTVVFYQNEEQERAALESKKALEGSGRFAGKPIVTRIEPASRFYPAEDYHQKYYRKSRLRYELYHGASGRDSFFKRIWGPK